MGGGVSNLTPEQIAEVSRRVQNTYDACRADNLHDEVLQSKITSEYMAAVAAVALTESRSVPNCANIPVVVAEKKSVSKPAAKKKATRRRSFDTTQRYKPKIIPAQAAVDIIPVVEALEVSRSEEAITIPGGSTDAIDNWDSVTQQPFCELCQMAFKSAGFLDRHIKYSSVHASAEKKLRGDTKPERALDIKVVEEEQVLVPLPKQTEGIHYKPIYNGTKLFWRTQKSIDFNFYHHILPATIEVISFDSEKHKELNRIYLDYENILEIIEPKIVEGMAAKDRENDAEKQRDRFFDFTEAQRISFEAELRRTTLITFILQRLQLQSIVVENANVSSGVAFVRQSVDDFVNEPLLETYPVILVPVSLTRRRRTNAEDHHNIMNSLSMDHDAINNYLQSAVINTSAQSSKMPRPRKTSSIDIAIKAERIASIMHSFVNLLQAAVTEQKRYRVIQRKWTKAIKRVMRRKRVAQSTRILERMLQAGSPGLIGPFGSPKVRREDMSPVTTRKSGVNVSGKIGSFSDSASAQEDMTAEQALRGGIGSTKSPALPTSFRKKINVKAAMVN